MLALLNFSPVRVMALKRGADSFAAVAGKRRMRERRAATTRGRRDMAGVNMGSMYHKAKRRNQEGKTAHTENTESTERRKPIR